MKWKSLMAWASICFSVIQAASLKQRVDSPEVNPFEASPSEGEPLLRPNPARLSLYPIKYNDIWLMYKKAELSLWRTEEIDCSNDIVDLEQKLKVNERSFILEML